MQQDLQYQEALESAYELALKIVNIYEKSTTLVDGQVPVAEKPQSVAPISEDPEQRIGQLLQQLGIAIHIRGYGYLKTGVKLVLDTDSLLFAVTKELYPMIAKAHGTTAQRAKRAMRHAIEKASDKCNPYWKKHFSSYPGNKPTNSEFFAWCVEYLLFQK
jgi:two-component system response regulator (stage 0 sporulation protein A)